MGKKQGQAAMEFLITYGWAILVVLIAISTLAYFGVIDMSRFLPESCTIVPGLSCVDFKVTPTEITLVVQNVMGVDLYDMNISVGGCQLECEGCWNPIINDDKTTWSNYCSQKLGKFKEIIFIDYKKGEKYERGGVMITRNKQGKIITKVIASMSGLEVLGVGDGITDIDGSGHSLIVTSIDPNSVNVTVFSDSNNLTINKGGTGIALFIDGNVSVTVHEIKNNKTEISCSYSQGDNVHGCTDSAACNYDSEAILDNGSCYYCEGNIDCFTGIDCSLPTCSEDTYFFFEGGTCMEFTYSNNTYYGGCNYNLGENIFDCTIDENIICDTEQLCCVDECGVCGGPGHECDLDDTQCFDNDTFQTCGDYNIDGCLEWGDNTDCEDEEICGGGECSEIGELLDLCNNVGGYYTVANSGFGPSEYCWFRASSASKDCNQACSDYNLFCSPDNWNDIGPDCPVHTSFGDMGDGGTCGDGYCQVSTSTDWGIRAPLKVNTLCIYRSTDFLQDCDIDGLNSWPRVCACTNVN